MAHAQKLIPIEQLLSEMPAAPRGESKPVAMPAPRKTEPPAVSRPGYVSPFASDSARKSGKTQLSAEPVPGPRVAATQVVMGTAAPELASQAAPRLDVVMPPEDVRLAVLNALGEAGHRMVVSMLEAGEWKTSANELLVQVASSDAVIEMSLGSEARKVAMAAASGALGRPVKLRVISGLAAQNVAVGRRPASNGSGRSRAEQDPIVQRMKEKFGAEIRTIIDYREKR
jgi:DNA polymerase-3 subunit gamma/tau